MSAAIKYEQTEVFKIKYETSGAIEAGILGEALVAISSDFRNYALQEIEKPQNISDREYEFLLPVLVVDKTENGSLTLWFSTQYAQMKGWLESGASLVGYAKRLKSILDYFSKKSDTKPSASLKELQLALKQILPSVANAESPMLIEARSGNELLNVYYGKDAIKLANSRIRAEVGAKESITASQPYHKVVFFWHRAVLDASKKTGDQGVIQEISERPVRTVIDDPDIKQRMLEGPIATRAYLVTAKASYKYENPILYQILALHEIIDQ